MHTKHEENLGRMPELTGFDTIYSAIGRLIVVDLTMKDSMTGHIEDPHNFPDLHLSIRADMARELATELLKCADAIDLGMSHPSLKLID